MKTRLLSFLFIVLPFSVSAAPVDVVEILSFSCPFCAMANVEVGRLEKVINEQQGEFVPAPLNLTAESTPWEVYAYYTISKKRPDLERVIRERLFFAADIERGWRVTTPDKPLVYLESTPYVAKNYEQLYDEMLDGSVAQSSISKAIKIAAKAKIDKLPAFVFLHKGKVIGVVSRKKDKGDYDPALLIDAAIDRYRLLSNRYRQKEKLDDADEDGSSMFLMKGF